MEVFDELLEWFWEKVHGFLADHFFVADEGFAGVACFEVFEVGAVVVDDEDAGFEGKANGENFLGELRVDGHGFPGDLDIRQLKGL